jgi:hypothetical protein
MRRSGPGLLLLVMVAAGCRSPQEKVEDARKDLRSWAATLRLAAEQAGDGRLSRTFRRELARSANREIGDQVRRLRKLAASGGGDEAGTLAVTAERLVRAAPAIAADDATRRGADAPLSAIERDLAGSSR